MDIFLGGVQVSCFENRVDSHYSQIPYMQIRLPAKILDNPKVSVLVLLGPLTDMHMGSRKANLSRLACSFPAELERDSALCLVVSASGLLGAPYSTFGVIFGHVTV